jgi:hypothetical protein
MNNMKLYRVQLNMKDSGTGTDYGYPYVVAENADEALQKVQRYLAEKDLGFKKDREMSSIYLLAEEGDFPDCRVQLFL